MDNPWNIQSIYDLHYFNCPSCSFKNHYKQELVNHACENHPECIDYLANISDNSLSDIIFPTNQEIKTEDEFQGQEFIPEIKIEPVDDYIVDQGGADSLSDQKYHSLDTSETINEESFEVKDEFNHEKAHNLQLIYPDSDKEKRRKMLARERSRRYREKLKSKSVKSPEKETNEDVKSPRESSEIINEIQTLNAEAIEAEKHRKRKEAARERQRRYRERLKSNPIDQKLLCQFCGKDLTMYKHSYKRIFYEKHIQKCEILHPFIFNQNTCKICNGTFQKVFDHLINHHATEIPGFDADLLRKWENVQLAK